MNSKIAVAVGMAAIVAAMLIPLSTPTPAYAAEVAVSITAGSQTKTTDAFAPNPVKVNVGDTIKWTNDDSTLHTATSGNPSDGPSGVFGGTAESPVYLGPKQTQTFTATEAGEFPYYCTLHPTMVGTVMVAAGGNGDNGEEPTGPTMTLMGTTTSGDYQVSVDWTSNEIGKENIFAVSIMDAEGKAISGATYNIMLFKGDEHLVETHREDQTAAEQKYTFDEQGSYTLRIENINGSGTADGIDMPIQVTPEFPLGVFALMAAVFGAIIFASRSKLQLPKF